MDLPDRLRGLKAISVHYGIRWIAVQAKDADAVMNRVYKYRTRNATNRDRINPLDQPVAEFLRSAFPSLTSDVLKGKAKQIKIVGGGTMLLATPQRPYSEWRYDFMKSDICVIGPAKMGKKITKKFNRLTKVSLSEKKKAMRYVGHAVPYLDRLAAEGLLIGVLGRGSYFTKNGFPSKDVDINFILFAKDSEKETTNRILRTLRSIPKFAITLIDRKEKTIKRGENPALNFVIVSKDQTARMRIGEYERHVLRDGIAIGLPHLPKRKSYAVVRIFVRLQKRKNK